MQPKLTSILERLEKAPDLLSRRTWPRPYALTELNFGAVKSNPEDSRPLIFASA